MSTVDTTGQGTLFPVERPAPDWKLNAETRRIGKEGVKAARAALNAALASSDFGPAA